MRKKTDSMETLKNSNVEKPLPVSIIRLLAELFQKIVQTIHFTKNKSTNYWLSMRARKIDAGETPQ